MKECLLMTDATAPRCEDDRVHQEIIEKVDQALPCDEILYDLAELFKIFGDTTRIKILYVLDVYKRQIQRGPLVAPQNRRVDNKRGALLFSRSRSDQAAVRRKQLAGHGNRAARCKGNFQLRRAQVCGNRLTDMIVAQVRARPPQQVDLAEDAGEAEIVLILSLIHIWSPKPLNAGLCS